MPHTKSSRSLDYILSWSLRHPLHPALRWTIIVTSVMIIATIRSMFITELLPWLFFIPVILLCSLMLGRAEGIGASLLSAIAAAISIGDAENAFWLTQAQWAGSFLFLITTFAMAVLASELRFAFARAARLGKENLTAVTALAEREAFLTSVLSSSTDCIKVLDLDGRLTFMSEGGMNVMEVSDFNAIVGCPWPDFWQGQGNKEAIAALAAARSGEARSFIGKADTMRGTTKWWDVAVSPIIGPSGKPERILSVSRDITASRQHEEHNRQLSRIIETSSDFIGMADLDGRIFFLNDAALALIGLGREKKAGLTIRDLFPADEAEIVEKEVLPVAAATGHWSGERAFRHFETGELIPVLHTVFPVVDHDGTLMGYGTVTRDFRDRKAAEAELLLLNNELGHRLKNVLSVVQSVVSQTLRQAQDLASAKDALASRLTALGEATSVLTSSAWESADLKQLVRSLLEHHGNVGNRIIIDGPAVTLFPQGTLAFALALHELATNAVKYGALSNETGLVRVTWSVIDPSITEQGGEQSRFELLWKESGGPAVAQPRRRGFGTTMIERSLTSYFRGEATMEYAQTGFEFRLDCPLGAIGELKD
ncbi:PAS domain-containing protein [Agrobacterium genomosp. 3]|uniref:PAS domain-containing protein n=1 Tax=Agrobacterium tomkonis TaxID=1183410 RepID=UPI001CD8F022|nr:PAS domain-containing protein [Agrobacterium tomkonis]MCA1878841.1 PAS domain-containing protein [Agrobacterium tumefaciens]MCA1894077.1 PAS domain-containing protein [Agrobacterium tomkonis]